MNSLEELWYGNLSPNDQLRQYLHISPRKMKYLMDHNYIPHVNTGKPTHKYQVRPENAHAFKTRLEKDDRLQAVLRGQFSSRDKKPTPQKVPLDLDALEEFLRSRWNDVPEAMDNLYAAKLLRTNKATLNRLAEKGLLTLHYVKRTKYFTKEDILQYQLRPEVALHPTIGNYGEILSEFYKSQREREA